MGIGDTPQQAKMQGVYHLALLATLLYYYRQKSEYLGDRDKKKRCKAILDATFFNLNSIVY